MGAPNPSLWGAGRTLRRSGPPPLFLKTFDSYSITALGSDSKSLRGIGVGEPSKTKLPSRRRDREALGTSEVERAAPSPPDFCAPVDVDSEDEDDPLADQGGWLPAERINRVNPLGDPGEVLERIEMVFAGPEGGAGPIDQLPFWNRARSRLEQVNAANADGPSE